MKILIITGPPYSGKGTQCDLLKTSLGYKHISTGDRIREEKKLKTEIGEIMTFYEENGSLVPDEIMKDLINKIIDENILEKGIILDGYPRTKPQVDTLLNLLKGKNLVVDTVINIDVPKNELLKRAKKRAENSNRKDDQNPEIHIKRIEIFEKETRPAIEYMKEQIQVKNIDGQNTIEHITKEITQIINNNC